MLISDCACFVYSTTIVSKECLSIGHICEIRKLGSIQEKCGLMWTVSEYVYFVIESYALNTTHLQNFKCFKFKYNL